MGSSSFADRNKRDILAVPGRSMGHPHPCHHQWRPAISVWVRDSSRVPTRGRFHPIQILSVKVLIPPGSNCNSKLEVKIKYIIIQKLTQKVNPAVIFQDCL